MSAKDFQIVSRLGEGSYSSVWKVKRLSDGKEYAMKKVKMNSLSDKEKENALNEVRILASLQSPFIIGYKEAFFDDNSMTLCIVMEYANAGDIYNRIQTHMKNRTYFPEKEIWKVFIQVLKGLKLLHDKKILHRDLKCANVFLSAEGAKIGDLNVSKVAKGALAYTQTGTPYYASPEVWSDKPYDAKSDIWSLGCVIYEMAALKPPFRATDMQGLYKKVQKGVFDRIPSQYSTDLANAISLCLQTSPSQRPSSDQLLNHPLIVKNSKEINAVSNQEPANSELLSTIKMPKNMRALAQQLPKSNYNQEISSPDQIDRSRPSTTADKERPTVQNSNSSKPQIERVQSAQVKRSTPQSNNAQNYNAQIYANKPSMAKKETPVMKSQPKETEQEYLIRMQKEYLERQKALISKGIDPRMPPPQQNIPNRQPIVSSNPSNQRQGGVINSPAAQNHYNANRYDNIIKPSSREASRGIVQSSPQLRERPLSHKPDSRNQPVSQLQRPASNYARNNAYEQAKAAPKNYLEKGKKVEQVNRVAPTNQNFVPSSHAVSKADDREILQKYNNIYNLKQQYDQIQAYNAKKDNYSVQKPVAGPYGNINSKADPSRGVGGQKPQAYQNNNVIRQQQQGVYKQGVVRPGWWG